MKNSTEQTLLRPPLTMYWMKPCVSIPDILFISKFKDAFCQHTGQRSFHLVPVKLNEWPQTRSKFYFWSFPGILGMSLPLFVSICILFLLMGFIFSGKSFKFQTWTCPVFTLVSLSDPHVNWTVTFPTSFPNFPVITSKHERSMKGSKYSKAKHTFRVMS